MRSESVAMMLVMVAVENGYEQGTDRGMID